MVAGPCTFDLHLYPDFAKFLHELAQPIDKTSFTVAELKDTLNLVTNSLAFYKIKSDRMKRIKFAFSVLVDGNVNLESRIVTPASYPTAILLSTAPN